MKTFENQLNQDTVVDVFMNGKKGFFAETGRSYVAVYVIDNEFCPEMAELMQEIDINHMADAIEVIKSLKAFDCYEDWLENQLSLA